MHQLVAWSSPFSRLLLKDERNIPMTSKLHFCHFKNKKTTSGTLALKKTMITKQTNKRESISILMKLLI